MDTQTLLIGISIGYIGSMVACYVDYRFKKANLQAFMDEFVVFVEDDDE